ncbi:hypothetical protein B0H14DRAFT_2867742, partial [Mycena olivaceomarginata]
MLDHQCFPNAELEKLMYVLFPLALSLVPCILTPPCRAIPNSLPLANGGLSRFTTGMSAPPSAGGTRRRRFSSTPSARGSSRRSL